MWKQYNDTEFDSSLKNLDSNILWKTIQEKELKNRLLADIELLESQGKLKSIFQGENVLKNKWTLPIIKYTAAIVLICILTVSSALVSPAFANFVTNIPLVGTAFNYFVSEKAYYEEYEKLSTAVGLVEESSGVEIIIDQAIYDGNMVTLSFIIPTDDEFETPPRFDSLPQVQEEFGNSSYDLEFVKGVGYMGIMTLSMVEDERKKVNITWEPKSITTESKTIQGDWKFQFSLEKIPGTYIVINQEVSNSGVTVRLIDAQKTDVNLTINYSQMVDLASFAYVEAELCAIDNLGNEYKAPYNSGEGIVGSNSSEDWMWNATIHGLDKKATSITFYPFAHISNETFSKRIDFDPITVNLK